MNKGVLLLFICSSWVAWGEESVTTLSAPTPTATKPAFRGSWGLGMSTDFADSETSSQQIVIFDVKTTIKYRLTSYLYIDFAPKFKFQTGRTDSLIEERKLGNKVGFRKGTLELDTHVLRASVGAINMPSAHSDLMFDTIAFPGIRSSALAIKNEEYELGAGGEVAIPSSTSLSPEASDLEPTPTFNAWGAHFTFEQNDDHFFTARAQAFEFRDLPRIVAEGSAAAGNSVQKDDTALKTPRFTYGFRGYEASVLGGTDIGDFLLPKFAVHYIENQLAPRELSQAYSAEISLGQKYKDFTIAPKIRYYDIAPDAFPAFYSGFGRTNSQGYGTGVCLELPLISARVNFEYLENRPLFVDPYLSPGHEYVISVETFNEKF